MYFALIEQFVDTLTNLDGILLKATENATARGFDVNNFMQARLAPDMLPFWRQVTIACDTSKAIAAALAGKTPPRFEDNEQTFEDVRARIAKNIEYLKTFQASDFEGLTADKVVPIPYPPGKGMKAQAALVTRAVPNFFFHVNMTYALLRHGGVPIGKTDYLGQLEILDM